MLRKCLPTRGGGKHRRCEIILFQFLNEIHVKKYLVLVPSFGVDVEAVAVVRAEDDAHQRLQEPNVGVVQDGVGEWQSLLGGRLLLGKITCYKRRLLLFH